MTDILNDDVEVGITIGVCRPAISSPMIVRWTDDKGEKYERTGTLLEGVRVPATEFMRALRCGTLEIIAASSDNASLTINQKVFA